MSIIGIKAIVTDIEGTTSSIRFVHDVLFPYAKAHIPEYVRTHDVADILGEVRAMENKPDLSTEGLIETLLRWIAEDRKITPLKTLQGMVWEEGYKAGAFKGHIYDDAAEALSQWFSQGLKIYVYSSGSVAAQKLLYGYSEKGDLTPLFSGYFDTTTGPKLEASSYTKIATSIGFKPSDILFLSDHAGEIEAAQKAGYQVVLVDRDAIKSDAAHSFSDIHIREKAA